MSIVLARVRAFCMSVSVLLFALTGFAVDINSAEEFISSLTANPSGDYALTADIDFTGVQQNTIPAFSGELNGNGHSISGLTNPVFDKLTGTVKELAIRNYSPVVKEVFPNTTDLCRGIIANVASDGALLDHVVVSNCVFVSSRTITQYVGGMIGRVTEAMDAGVLIKDSIVVDSRIGSSGAPDGAGFVAKSDRCVLTISRCEVADSEIIGARAGGILARCDNVGSTNNIIGCIVSGVVNGSSFAGGICSGGRTTVETKSGPSVVNITKCRNNADVSAGTTGDSAAGGIYGGTYRNGIITITDCENHGNVSGSGRVNGDGYGIGGIFGGILGNTSSAPTPVTIIRSVNYGDVTASYSSAGGIVGNFGSPSANPTFEYVSNYGNISAADFAGGLFGRCDLNYNKIPVRNGANYGAVVSVNELSVAGGIFAAYIGNSSYGDNVNVLNYATVSAEGAAGFYFGASEHAKGAASLTFKNCWLVGSVTADITGVFNASAGDHPDRALTFAVDSASRVSVSGAQHTWYDQSGVAHDESLAEVPDGALVDGTAASALGDDWEQAAAYPHMKFENDCAPAAIAFDVAFQDYDGSLIGSTQKVVRGCAAVAPPDPSRENYTFVGWDPADFSAVDRDLTIVARYESLFNVHNVTFRSEDGGLLQVVEVNDGETVSSRSAPVKTGYDFAGWTLDGVVYDFTTPVKTDITLVASYVIKMYAVTFLDWDGARIGSVQMVEYQHSAVAPELPALPTGKIFRQWDCDFSCVVAPLTVRAVIGDGRVFVSAFGTDDASHGSLDHPFNTIAYAVSFLSDAGGIVELLPGTYSIKTQITLSTPVSVRKYGEAEGEVIVRNDRSSTGYGSASRCFTITHAAAMVSDITIENGWVSCADSGKGGGNVYMTAGMVSNCVIRNSYVMQSSGTHPHGGGVHLNGESAVIANCVVSNCTVGADSDWIGKCAAGIHVDKGLAENCLVVDCRTDKSSPSFENVVGGMAVGSGGKIVNCTVIGCRGSATGGIHSDNISGMIANSVAFGCEKYVHSTLTRHAFSGVAASYFNCASDMPAIEGGTRCIGEIVASAFVDYAAGNYAPKPMGALYNAGDGDKGSGSPYDLAGLKRVVKVIDIGAFESQYVPGFVITGKRID